MSTQALNFINLYRGQDPNKVFAQLNMQGHSVVNELKEHFKTNDLVELTEIISKM